VDAVTTPDPDVRAAYEAAGRAVYAYAQAFDAMVAAAGLNGTAAERRLLETYRRVLEDTIKPNYRTARETWGAGAFDAAARLMVSTARLVDRDAGELARLAGNVPFVRALLNAATPGNGGAAGALLAEAASESAVAFEAAADAGLAVAGIVGALGRGLGFLFSPFGLVVAVGVVAVVFFREPIAKAVKAAA
jgi:hypothetical protein